ncbi:MAG: hypothetical protein ACLTLQ_09780 [[Clostridium] scindens]
MPAIYTTMMPVSKMLLNKGVPMSQAWDWDSVRLRKETQSGRPTAILYGYRRDQHEAA